MDIITEKLLSLKEALGVPECLQGTVWRLPTKIGYEISQKKRTWEHSCVCSVVIAATTTPWFPRLVALTHGSRLALFGLSRQDATTPIRPQEACRRQKR